METTAYVTLARQSALMREMQIVANNVANSGTAGFRREAMVFSEFVRHLGDGPSVSMARGQARRTDLSEGDLRQTGGSLDFAIRGEGFFLIRTAEGDRLTRSGAFSMDAQGGLSTADGHALLDAGGAPIILPAGEGPVSLASDGTLAAGGQPVARIGLWAPDDPMSLRQRGGSLLEARNLRPAEGARLMQGMLEESNVRPVEEIARMIEVQRAYELGQGFLDREDERMRGMIRTFGG